MATLSVLIEIRVSIFGLSEGTLKNIEKSVLFLYRRLEKETSELFYVFKKPSSH